MILRLLHVAVVAVVAAVAGGLLDGLLAAWTAEHLSRGLYGLALAELAATLARWLRIGLPAVAAVGVLAVLARDSQAPLRTRPSYGVAVFVAAFAAIAGTQLLPATVPLGGPAWLAPAVADLLRLAAAGVATVVALALWRGAAASAAGRRAWAVAAVLAVVLAGAVFGAARQRLVAAGERPNVLVFVIDCLRADRLGSYGYPRATSPFLDAVAKRAMVFEQATSAAPWTKPSVTSMWTGVLTERHGAADPYEAFPDALVGLPERLSDAGYATWFLNGGNTFISDRFGFDRGFDEYVFRGERRAGSLNEQLAKLLRQRDPARPFFGYVHYMDLHLPYHQNPINAAFERPPWIDDELMPGRITMKPVRMRTHQGSMGPARRRWLNNLYDAQVRFVDNHLARVFRMLGEQGVDENTWIVVTADHGEELWDHGNFEHGHSVYEEVIHVPLMVVGPGLEAQRVVAPVSLVDLMPTVLGWAGIDFAGQRLDGVDLMAYRDGGRVPERTIYSSGILYGPRRYAVRRGDWKAIHNTDDDRGKWHLIGPRSLAPWQLFDLGDDPAEATDLQGAAATTRATLAAELEALRAEARAASGPAVTFDRELQEELRALGYVQ